MTKRENEQENGSNLLQKILFLLCMILILPVSAQAAAEQLTSLNDLYVTGFLGDTLSEQEIHWKKDDGKYYLCMPAAADLSSVKLHFGGNVTEGTVMINGTSVTSGETIDLSKEKTVQISLARSTITVNILQSANVPSVFIATESGNLNKIHASKENKESGTMQIVKADKTVDYDGTLKQIKGRGNATWNYAKKPYNIKLDKAAGLLGLGKEKGFCLLANYTDYSLLRNRIVYDLAEEVGIPFTMDARSIDLYINGDYMGAYLLTEKIEIGENVVDIVDLEGATEDVNSEDLDSYAQGGTNRWAVNTQKWVDIPNNPEDITGGYLLEMELNDRYPNEVSGFVTTGGQAVVIKYPEYASKNQVKYISSFYQELEDAIYSETGYNSLGKHFSDYIDVESFARMYALQEFAMNLDVGITSFYLYKDSDLEGDGKIHAAPVWDFDRALGNYSSRNGVDLTNPTQWYAKIAKMHSNANKLNIMSQAVTHEEIMKKAAEIWEKELAPVVKVLLGEETTHQPKDLKSLDEYKAELEASAAMNYIEWDPQSILKSGVDVINTGLTFEANMDYLESFISRRRDFMDEKMGALLHPVMTDIEEDTRFKAAEKILNSSGLQTEATSDTGGGENLSYCDAGYYAEYKINVKNSGTYNVTARIASEAGRGAFDLIVDGVKLASFKAVRTGGWQNWTTLSAQQINLVKGEHDLKIAFTEAGSNLNWLQFTLVTENGDNQLSAREQLQTAYDIYTEIDTSRYTSQSVTSFRSALEEAKVILVKADAKDEELETAISNLKKAFETLEYRAETAHLETAVQAAEVFLRNADLFDVTNLVAVVKAGRDLLETETASQKDIDAAAQSILMELDKLERVQIEVGDVLLGDVDKDGIISTSDAVEILRASTDAVELDAVQLVSGDVNRNGKVNLADALLILQYAAEKIESF